MLSENVRDLKRFKKKVKTKNVLVAQEFARNVLLERYLDKQFADLED